MSRSSYLTLYCRHKDVKLSDQELTNLKRQYFSKHEMYSLNSYGQKEETKFEDVSDEFYPYILEKYPYDYESEKANTDSAEVKLAKARDNYVDINGYAVDQLVSVDFISNFTALWDHYYLGTGCPVKNDVVIDAAAASKILEAVNYLLLGKFDDDIEAVMSNDFIAEFGDSYPKYYTRKWSKKSISESAADIAEDNVAARNNMLRVQALLRTYMEQWNYDENVEYFLVYEVSY